MVSRRSTHSSVPRSSPLTRTFFRKTSEFSTGMTDAELVVDRDREHRRLRERLGVGVGLEVDDDVLLRVLHGDERVLLGPGALQARVVGRGLGAVPAVLVDEEDVLGAVEELEAPGLVLAQADVLALQSDALALAFGIEAEADVDRPDVGEGRHEYGARVAVGLARFPILRRAGSARGRRRTAGCPSGRGSARAPDSPCRAS